ncbi:MAG TPA: carboxypeptidase-like regulatory domain-containing protein [Pyrinomonadaceae bacterium]|nr:carboxypeptidase-like regulatory domain-containing protein [Pyrinomonadaceae bacterium]
MTLKRTIPASVAVLLLATLAVAQDRSTGTLKGKVKVEVGTPAGVAVIVKQGEREVGRAATDKNGEFVTRVPPGIYELTFRKPGLSVGTIEKIEVKAGKTRSLGDRLVLTIDEGSIAFIRGSVFNHQGLSVRGARVELARIQEDGSARKIDGRITNETGSFVFRLMPDTAKYRLTAKVSGADAVSKDIDIDGPAVYRLALSFPPTPK